MKLNLDTDGICAKGIEIEVEEGKIVSVEFVGGTPGNPVVLEALAKGKDVNAAIECLRTLACNGDASCPGRLALALEKAINNY